MLRYGTAGQAADDNKIRRILFECWITKPTHTHSEYVLRISFPRKKWLHECASILRLYVHLLLLFYGSLLILIPVLLQGFVFLLAVFTTSINVASVITLLFVLFVSFSHLPNHHYKHRTAHRSIFCCHIVSQ